jgi:hypothetical protein
MEDAADRARALSAEGDALLRAGALDAAEACYREAAALAPTAGRLHNLGTARQLKGDHAAAEPVFRQALALDPDNPRVTASLGLTLLALGRLAEGFATYDSWRRVPNSGSKGAPDIGVPWWSGQDVAGKNIVVWGEEGYGDQIMFARFAGLLREAGAKVAWVCHRAMARLVREGLGMDALATGGAIEITGADYVAPTSRLPVVFMQRLAAPPAAPYLAAPRPNVIEGLRVGVVARGNPDHPNDRYRSLPPEVAAELMALPGAVSLAPEETGARDFWDTASVVAGLDLVIAVDTSVAHLAGAMGKPVWLLLAAVGCDWRWGSGPRTDSPWYPSMRLFRQTAPGDWSGVLAQVKAAFAAKDAPPQSGGAVSDS